MIKVKIAVEIGIRKQGAPFPFDIEIPADATIKDLKKACLRKNLR